jgi:Subtilase family
VFHDLENCRKFLDFLKYKVEQHPELRAWSAKLWNSPVKIAVIDNGTDKFRHPTSQNIQKGITFMDSGILDGRVLPWYTAADAHGTQMAYLIRRVNPQCHLFVARVGTFRRDIKPEAAVNAIQWAVSQKVDIISISWITRRRSKPLYNAIREAAKTTLIFGTTADEGTNAMHEKIWPKRVIRVSASDSMGHPRPQSEASDDKVDFLLQGEAIMAYGPKYMDKVAESRISGSSVATALAAGVGSLLLTLARLYDLDDNRHSDRFKKKKHMITLFENLYNNDTDRVVVLGKLLKRKFDYDKLKQELPFILKEFRYQGREDDEDDDTDSEDGH